jgi:hypothetical protein
MPALSNYQFHFIARLDDTNKVTYDNIIVRIEFDIYYLKTKLKGTTNVQEGTAAPWRMMMYFHILCLLFFDKHGFLY